MKLPRRTVLWTRPTDLSTECPTSPTTSPPRIFLPHFPPLFPSFFFFLFLFSSHFPSLLLYFLRVTNFEPKSWLEDTDRGGGSGIRRQEGDVAARTNERGWIEESRSLNETHWPIDSSLHSSPPVFLSTPPSLQLFYRPAFVGVPRRPIRNSISCLTPWTGVTFERVDIIYTYIHIYIYIYNINTKRVYKATNECLKV